MNAVSSRGERRVYFKTWYIKIKMLWLLKESNHKRIRNLYGWLNELSRNGVDKNIIHLNVIKSFDNYETVRLSMYTENNKYAIYAAVQGSKSYLSCQLSSRRQRPGEDWWRERDVADGVCTKDTWNDILNGIIYFELKESSNRATESRRREYEIFFQYLRNPFKILEVIK